MGDLEATDSKVAAAVEAAQSAATNKTVSAAELLQLAENAQDLIQKAKEELVKRREAAVALNEGVDDALKSFMESEVKKLETKITDSEARLTKATHLAAKGKEEAKKKEIEEASALEKKGIAMIKYHQAQHKLSNADMVADIDSKKDDKIDADELKAFYARCDKAPKGENGDGESLSDADLARLFAGLDESKEGAISKDQFLNIIRTFKKVAKDTVATTELSIKASDTKRRLEAGEVVEVLKGPEKEEECHVLRVFVKVMKDDMEAWVTLSGNDGALFLEDGGNLFKVVKETIMTSEFALDAGVGQASRKLKQGEVVEVREWPKKEEKSGLMRMKCKARSSGAIGWVTTVGNQGNVYLEVC